MFRGIAASMIGLVLMTGTAGAAPGDFAGDAPPTHSVIATIEHGDRTYEFVRSTTGGIVGVAEIAPAGSPSMLSGALHDATPAEVYLAVAGPDATVPPELAAHHLSVLAGDARGGAGPRLLNIATPNRSGGRANDVGTAYCSYDWFAQPGDSQFAADWFWNLGQYKDFSYQQAYQWDNSFSDEGHHWNAGVTTSRWLGACNGGTDNGGGTMYFYAEALGLNGTWFTAYGHALQAGEQVIYASFSPGTPRWRVNLMGNIFALPVEFSVAVAGNRPIDDMVWQLPPGGGRGGDGPGPAGDTTPSREELSVR
jgi:hypothetical protein